MKRSRKKNSTNPSVIYINTLDSSTSSIASGSRSKYAAPRIDPAEKATRNNKIPCKVSSFKDKLNIPAKENIETMDVATIILMKIDN